MKRSITNTILLINILCLAAAWYATPITKMHRWHLIVGSIHQSSSLFLASDGEECSATPEIPSLSIVDTGRTAAANPLTRRPKKGDIVTFTLHKFEPTSSKEVVYPFDTSGTLQLMMHSGHYIPSLHDLLATMNPGETVKSAIIDAEYGPYRDELKITIPTSQLGDVDTSLVKVGTKLAFGDVECAITSMTEEDWVCDANHPMALNMKLT
jgi:FKBP-type peptidyl-prolyl cis-trans isomerase 2